MSNPVFFSSFFLGGGGGGKGVGGGGVGAGRVWGRYGIRKKYFSMSSAVNFTPEC